MCVCARVYVYMRTCVRVYVYVHVCMCVCKSYLLFKGVSKFPRSVSTVVTCCHKLYNVCVCVCVCVCVYVCVCVCVCVRVCVFAVKHPHSMYEGHNRT